MKQQIRIGLFVLIFILLLWDCDHITEPSGDHDFGIYLLKDTTLTTVVSKDISRGALITQDDPLIGMADIISYNWTKQRIQITSEAATRIANLSSKIKSIYGLPFIFLAQEKKIYLGNIYPTYSSYIHPDLPFITVAPFIELQIIRAPSKEAADQRIDDRIYQVLKKQDKLRD